MSFKTTVLRSRAGSFDDVVVEPISENILACRLKENDRYFALRLKVGENNYWAITRLEGSTQRADELLKLLPKGHERFGIVGFFSANDALMDLMNYFELPDSALGEDWEMKKQELELTQSLGSKVLKDKDRVLIASPISWCESCRKSARIDKFKKTKVIALDKNGEARETDKGHPVFETRTTCASCAQPKINMSDRGSHVPVLGTPTYNHWPFPRTVGIELECLMVGPTNQERLTELGFRAVHDASIGSFPFEGQAVEWNTPPLEGDEFFEKVREGLSLIGPNARVNKTCGLHVHISWIDMTQTQKANTQNLLIRMQDLMFALQPPSRHTNKFCRFWKGTELATPERLLESDKYQGVNFSHMMNPQYNAQGKRQAGGYGTVEFRMGAGTRNPRKIFMWVQFLSRLMEIGSEIESDWRALEGKSSAELLEIFFELTQKVDDAKERPPEFLDDLKDWMQSRFLKFKISRSTRKVEIKISEKVRSFKKAKLQKINDTKETFEEFEGIA